ATAKEKADEEAEAKADAAAQAKAAADARAKAKAEADAKAKAAAVAKAKADAEAKARRDAEVAKNFNANDIQNLLRSKEQSQSSGSSAPQQNRTASLGTQTGSAQKLSPSLRSQLVGLLRDQMERCFSPPVGASAGPVIKPVLDIRLSADGGLSADPRLIRVGGTPTDRAVADAASRAVRRCAPYRIPPQFAPYFNDWKVLNVEFDTTN
ncbi:MAG: cell envelope integrity protein TolA, partial [Bosea sp. (in: a-proteobacteria)]